MSDTKTLPLLSDRLYRLWELNTDPGKDNELNEAKLQARELEAKIARLDGLVQELVDDLSRAYCIDKPSLDLAKSLGIEPKTTT